MNCLMEAISGLVVIKKLYLMQILRLNFRQVQNAKCCVDYVSAIYEKNIGGRKFLRLYKDSSIHKTLTVAVHCTFILHFLKQFVDKTFAVVNKTANKNHITFLPLMISVYVIYLQAASYTLQTKAILRT